MTSQLAESLLPAAEEVADRGSILIIDDDETMSEVLAERLKRQCFRVIWATNGRDGLAATHSERPDLVLLDLMLPDVDGLSICQKLADSLETCHIPVIILSGMEGDDVVRRCRAAGSRYFLRKPYDPNALLLLIRDALGDGHWDER
jgi:two-component system cell cycle response regulator